MRVCRPRLHQPEGLRVVGQGKPAYNTAVGASGRLRRPPEYTPRFARRVANLETL
jgi:hypothetical protein